MGTHTLLAALLLPFLAGAQDAPPKSTTPAPSATPATPLTTPLNDAPAELGVDAARTSIGKALAWIVANQRPDGAWASGSMDSLQVAFFRAETHFAFQYAATALTARALLNAEETPERRKALEKSLEWLCTVELPKRTSDWDVDCSWSALFGFDCFARVALDPRFAAEPWKSKLAQRGKLLYALLDKNQSPEGGWGYYEGPVVSRRPTWATSFSTATVVPALCLARDKLPTWGVDPKLVERAVEYLRRCALPTGAYEYDLNPIPRVNGGEIINDVKGSLGRIQVCNWARRKAGDKRITDEVIRRGLGLFLEHHRFLDAARLKPVPHESWYQNAAYFYNFGHCYASLLVEELPEAERESWHAKLRPHFVKVQFEDGSTYDFIGNGWAEASGTSFLALALQAGVPAAAKVR